MSRKSNKPSIYAPKLPNIALMNSALSVRSATESADPSLLYNRGSFTPFTYHRKKESYDFRESAPASPQLSRAQSQVRQPIPNLMKSDITQISSVFNSKFFAASGKDFYASFDIQKDEEMKGKKKLEGLNKKREELLSLGTWNDEQSSMIKKLTFFLQETRSKCSEIATNSEAGTTLSQLFSNIENKIYSLLLSVHNTIEAAFKENLKTSRLLEEAQENLKRSNMNNKTENDKSEKVKKEVYLSFRAKESLGNSQHFAIQKLKTENEYLQGQLESLVKYQDVDKLNQELENSKADTRQKTEHYETELKNRETLLTKFEIMYNGTKKMNESLNQANKAMESKMSELYEEYSLYKKTYDTVVEERNMYRERALMQLADYESLKQQYNTLQEYFDTIKDRYLEEKDKAKKLNDPYALQEKAEASSTFSLEAQTLETITGPSNTNTGKAINLKKCEENSDKAPSDQGLKNYVFVKPSYNLLFPKHKMQNLQIKEGKLTCNFVATLRAIYDSKYNEFLYAENYTQISRFPDFVYSWMGKFTLDNATRKVRVSNIIDSDPEALRIEMIGLLQTPISARLWECIIFREFLEEKHTRDELLYFLHCRHMLFRGPQLNDQSASFSFSYYIKLEWAESVLEQLLGHKHSWEALNLMKAKFKERAKQKKNTLLIDAAFFLRIMLEEYKKEKADKFAVYKKALAENRGTLSPRHGKHNVSFETVKEFFNTYFPTTYEIEKVELYRKCWTYNNGNIDADGILTVLNEENFFSKSLNFGGLDEKLLPKGFHSSHQADEVYDIVLEQYKMLDSEISLLQNSAVRIGVEKFLVDNQEYEKRIRTHSFETKGFHGKDIHIELTSFFMHTYKLGNILLYLNGAERGFTPQNNVEEVFSTFRDTFYRINEAEDNHLREFEINMKTKKLQKFFKSKMSSWYKLMKFILRNKLQKFYNDKGELRFKKKT